MILCAGRGERMRPLTDTTPKPLLEVRGKPLVVWHIERLASLGFKEIVINTAHLGFMFEPILGNGFKWGVKIIYSHEEEGGLESAGGILKALPYLSETFLVVNGDVYTDYEFDKNFDLGGALAYLILVNNPKHNPKGDFGIKNHKLLNDGDKKYTFSGIGYYSKTFFKDLAYGKSALAPLIRYNTTRKNINATIFSGLWHDIGTIQRLNTINVLI